MKKTLIIWTILLTLSIALIVALETGLPKKVDWREYYSWNKNRPYDLSIFDNEWVGKQSKLIVSECSTSFYEFYTKEYLFDSTKKTLFLYIGGHFDMDSVSQMKFIEFIEIGNEAFISSNGGSEKLLQAFGKSTDWDMYWNNDDDTTLITLFGQELKIQTQLLNKKKYFLSNQKNYEALGGIDFPYNHNDTLVNFIKMNKGKGNLYFHLTPQVFTNFYLLNYNSYDYVNAALSFPEFDNIILYRGNNVFQSGFDINRDVINNNPLRFILSNKSLKWAWYFLIFGSFLWVIIYSKRKQRIIPINQPLKNTTVGFVKTIANLYYETKDYAFIIDKKLIYFFERLKTQYLIDHTELNSDWIDYVSEKLNTEKTNVEAFLRWYESYKKRDISTETDLIELNRILEKIENNLMNN